MPRNLSDAFIALEGRKSLYAPILLMEWRLNSGTHYFSSGDGVTWNGATWEANRLTAPTVTFGIIDGDHREFPRITLNLDNLPDSADAALPFQEIDAVEVFEDKLVILYVYSPDARSAFEFWRGRSIRPTYNGAEKTVDLNLSFIFDSLNLPVPSRSLPEAGFNLSGVETNQDDLNPAAVIPLYYGVGRKKIRPVVYRFQTTDSHAYVNFIVSGCAAGLPFNADDLINFRLKDEINPLELEFRPGGIDAAPENLTKYPDGLAHDDIAYGYALFPWSKEKQDDRIQPDDMRGAINNGRPLIDTGIPSENLPLIIKDILRDPAHGLGAADEEFDNDILAATADYTGTRYQARLELREQQALIDLIQQLLGEVHCFIAWPDGRIQIRAKRNDEAATASFATINSGQAGILIEDDIDSAEQRGFDEIPNQLKIAFRQANRHKPQPLFIRDQNAQQYAGGNYKKVSQEEIEFLALFDVEQVKTSGAIRLREGLQGNIYIKFRTPFYDSLRVVHGDLANVYGKEITNNAGNYVFRVLTETWNFGEAPYREFYCKLYKPAIYNDDYEGLEIDLERTGTDTSRAGRPDDVTPVSLAISDPVAGDGEGKLVTVTATCEIPGFDPTEEHEAGLFGLPPIAAWEPWYRYEDESPNIWRRGTTMEVAQTDQAFNSPATFLIDYYKNRRLVVQFVALGASRVKSKLGYIPDPTRATHLTALLSATAASAGVDDESVFAGAEYAICEFEIAKISGTAAGAVSFETDGHDRKPYFETSAIAHPAGTQLAVAKLSYPALTLSMTPPRFTYGFVAAIAVMQRPDGVKVRITDVKAANLEDYFTYWTTNAGFATDPTKLGSDNPAWFTTDPLTPPAGINLISGKALHFTIPQEDIGAAGTVVTVAVAARNGKHNWSSKLSPRQSSAVGDDAVPSLTSAPSAIFKNGNLKVVCALPLLNMKTFSTSGKVEIVIRAVDGSGATIGYLSDAGGTYALSAAEYKFNSGLKATEIFNLSKTGFKSLFAGIANLKIYFYVTNAVGTSAASPLYTLAVAAMDEDPIAPDTAVPAGLSTPVIKYQDGVLAVKQISASAGINQLDRYEVVIAGYDASDLLLGYIESSSWTFTASEATAKTGIGRAGKMPFHVKRSQLVTAFGAAAKIKAYFYAVNAIGPSLASTVSNALLLSTMEGEGVATDTDVPGGLIAPTLFKVKKNGSPLEFAKPTTNRNTWLHNLLVIADAAAPVSGVKVLTASDLTTATTLSSADDTAGRIQVGRKAATLTADRAQLEAIFGAGVTVYAWFYAVNEVGTSTRSAAAAFNLATGEGGSIGDDTAVPSGLIAPTFFKVKKNGTPMRFAKPTANRNTWLHNLAVIADASAPANGVKVLTAADLTTATTLASADDTLGRIEVSRKAATLPVDRAQLEAIFGAGVTVYLWFYAVNEVGISLRSTAASFNLATGEAGTVGDDIAAPSGLTKPTAKRLRKAGLRLVLIPPSAGNLKLRRANVYIANGAHGAATIWLSAADLTSATANEGTAGIETPPSGGHTITADRPTLEAIFGVGAIITIYATWSNDVGTSGFSAAETYNLAAGEAGAVGQDLAIPASLGPPLLVYLPRQGVHLEGLTVGLNWNTPADKWVVLYNGASTYFDLPAYLSSGGVTVQAAAGEAAARYRIGAGKNNAPFAIKLHDLKTVFGFTDPTNLFAYFYAANGFGTSNKSSDSAALNLFGAKDIMGSRDAVRVLDIAATNVSPGNMLGNGDCVLVNGADQQENWTRWDGLTTPIPAPGTSGAHQVITSTSSQIAYVSSTDSLWLKANTTWELLQNVKQRHKPGMSYALSLMIRAAAAITVTARLHLYNLSRPALTGTMNLTSTINCVGVGTLAGTEFSVGDDLVVSGQRRTVATITDALHWTVNAAFSAAGGALNVILDNINNKISQSIALTTSYQIFLAVISMKQTPNLASTAGGSDAVNHRFGLQLTGNTQDTFLDYFMEVRGQQPMMYAPRGDENDTFTQGTVPTFILVPDIIPISGTQGGGLLKDQGGLIDIQ